MTRKTPAPRSRRVATARHSSAVSAPTAETTLRSIARIGLMVSLAVAELESPLLSAALQLRTLIY